MQTHAQCACGNTLTREERTLSQDEGRDVAICHACYLIEVGDEETIAMNPLHDIRTKMNQTMKEIDEQMVLITDLLMDCLKTLEERTKVYEN